MYTNIYSQIHDIVSLINKYAPQQFSFKSKILSVL